MVYHKEQEMIMDCFINPENVKEHVIKHKYPVSVIHQKTWDWFRKYEDKWFDEILKDNNSKELAVYVIDLLIDKLNKEINESWNKLEKEGYLK